MTDKADSILQSNQDPEQRARDNIDKMLVDAGWKVQDSKKIDFNAGLGVAVREFQTDIGPADYALFSHGEPQSEVSRGFFA
jgi:type I restriction enzyme R subunit